MHNFLSGVKKIEASGFGTKNMTLDQTAAEHVDSTARYPSITTGIDEGTSLSWTRSGVRIPPVNNPAKLFQALIAQREDTFTRCLTEKLLTYALGREFEDGDRQVIDSILSNLDENGGGLHDLITQVVLSGSFGKN